jgi:hypothetical protein
VGTNGFILHSTGDGRWLPEESGTTAQLTGIWGRSPTQVYAYGLQSTLLVRQGNGQWRPIRSSFSGQYCAVWGPDASDDLVLAGEEFYDE